MLYHAHPTVRNHATSTTTWTIYSAGPAAPKLVQPSTAVCLQQASHTPHWQQPSPPPEGRPTPYCSMLSVCYVLCAICLQQASHTLSEAHWQQTLPSSRSPSPPGLDGVPPCCSPLPSCLLQTPGLQQRAQGPTTGLHQSPMQPTQHLVGQAAWDTEVRLGLLMCACPGML